MTALIGKMQPGKRFNSTSCTWKAPAIAAVSVFGFCYGTLTHSLLAGPSGSGSGARSLADKEIARRNAQVVAAQAILAEAHAAEQKGEHEQALKLYRQAWDLLPDSPNTAALKREARDGYSRAAIAQAAKLADEARYAAARFLLKSVLDENFDPDNKAALTLQKRLDDPVRYEPALTPEHLANVKVVEEKLRLGQGLVSLGDFDAANERFREVLRIDPYNAAARRGMEQAEQHKSVYFDAARDHTRSKMLAGVDAQWEDNVPVLDVSQLFGAGGSAMGVMGGTKDAILVKLRTIIVPMVDLQGASLEEVIEFLRIRSRELDPAKKGVGFVVKASPEARSKPVSMSMASVPLEEILRYATEMTGSVYRVDEFAVTVTSRAEKSETLIAKQYRVPPDFLQTSPAASAPAAGQAPAADPFAQAPAGGTNVLQVRRLGAKEFLEQRGVIFPEGAAASYNPSTNILFVRNTADNMAMVDTFVDQAVNATPKQVEIQVRMIEINETRLNELGFDWLMGQFNVPGSERVFGGGAGQIDPAEPVPFNANPLTNGLRSSGALLGVPSIDGLIGRATVPAANSKSPGMFAVSGVFTDPQFQVVIRGLKQSIGVDVLAAPTVVTKSGQRANITVAREFRYPTEFDPPQIPQSLNAVANGVSYTASFAPITPSTPTAFEKRDVGITLEVEPVVGDGNKTVELNLVPSSTEFEGFIDYGTDIQNTAPVGLNGSYVTYDVPNDILQPIFRTNKVTTSVSVWDGNTVVLGGVTFEKRQKIDDKVPVLGDLPLVGRNFQSKVNLVERKNVIFFVTVRVIDPAGNSVSTAGSSTVAR
ncbi:MAG TPA: Amuc_1098 family type IV pilus outer membrane protein [Verrucomicrobium sp.]|nr:Amuc_1098 family type IV pilus outer membrane protein [Verrucomicrobium sp.]